MNTIATRASWEALPHLPEPAGNFVCGALDGKLVFIGGITWKNDTKIWRDSVWTYEPVKGIWAEAGKAPEVVAYTSFGETKNGLYFVGGGDGKKTHAGLWTINSSLQFREVVANACALQLSGSAIHDDRLFVVGGADSAELKALTNGFFSVDLKSGRTQNLPMFPGGKVIVPATTAIKDHIYVFTGADLDADKKAINRNAAFVYSIKEAKWRPIKPYPLAARGVAACALDDRHILLAGGYENDFLDAAFIYDIKADSYSSTRSLPYRSMSSFIKAGKYVYWMGGEDKMRHRSDLFYRIAWKELIANAEEK